jgi:DNA-binding NtrC family response regulator
VIRGSVAFCEGEILRRPEIFLDSEPTEFEPHRLDPTAPPSQDSAARPHPSDEADLRLKTAEGRHIRLVLGKMGGNKTRTARALGISRSTLDRKLAAYRS